MKYSISLSLVLAALFFAGCNHTDPSKNKEARKARIDSLKTELLNIDIAFSELSEQQRRNAAFTEYADENATVLRPFSMPVTGKEAIVNLLKEHPDSSYKLTWLPISSDVSRSGDMGYTYGTYSLEIKNTGKEAGTYCTIWKRNKDHQWKFVMDTGNEGLSTEEKKQDQKIDAKKESSDKKPS